MKSFKLMVFFALLGTTVNAQVKVIPAGLFYGIIPCADCNGIETYIELNANKTGIVQEKYLGKEDKVSVAAIRWEMKQNLVTLFENEKQKGTYMFSNSNLKKLDAKGKAITGSLASKYILHKKKIVTTTNAWATKMQKGIDVIAMGNEPSWSLELDFEKQFNFTSIASDPITTPASKPVFENGGWSIKSSSGNNVLDIRIEPRYCNDGMSDWVYQYYATVTVNGKANKGVSVLLNSSFALNGEWEMDYLSGPKIMLEWRKMPTLNFDIAQNRVSGTDGCNRIMGSFKLSDNSGLSFSQMAGTMMACPDNNADFFNRALSKVNRFRIMNGKLELLSGEGLLVRMRRVVGS
jgi:heat shock protein HslJ